MEMVDGNNGWWVKLERVQAKLKEEWARLARERESEA